MRTARGSSTKLPSPRALVGIADDLLRHFVAVAAGSYRRTVAAAAVIRDADGRTLLVEPGYRERRWDLPGGRIARTESFEEGLVREVREETGLEVRVGRLLVVDTKRKHRVVLIFEAEVVGGEERARPAEIRRLGWFPADRLPEGTDEITRSRVELAERAVTDGGTALHLCP